MTLEPSNDTDWPTPAELDRAYAAMGAEVSEPEGCEVCGEPADYADGTLCLHHYTRSIDRGRE